MEIINIKDMTFIYPNSDNKALDSIDLSVNEGEFVVLSGYSGSGKTTLLRCLKPEIRPSGVLGGEISYCGQMLDTCEPKKVASEVGYLFQSPEAQTVTDRVVTELAFAMENLGFSQKEMERRIAEVANLFGLNSLLDKRLGELSGGQLQSVNLAAILTIKPKVLLLDEPTAMLDPIAAERFNNMVKRVNRELGITIIYSTHDYTGVLDSADRLIVLETGKLIVSGDVTESLTKLLDTGCKDLANADARLWDALNRKGNLPKNMLELKRMLKENVSDDANGDDLGDSGDIAPKTDEFKEKRQLKAGAIGAVKLNNVYFRYHKVSPDVIKSLAFEVYKEECVSIVGGNGSGKSTLLLLINESLKCYRGKVKTVGNVGYLPQLPELIFTKDKVCDLVGEKAYELAPDFLNRYSESHPYDLSGGEKGLLAFLVAIQDEPDILLLDEPSKGMDLRQKRILIDYIKRYKCDGKTVVIATHDLTFAAEVSDRIGLMFDGNVVGLSSPEDFFGDNMYYKTYISRVMAGIDDTCYLEEQIYELI